MHGQNCPKIFIFAPKKALRLWKKSLSLISKHKAMINHVVPLSKYMLHLNQILLASSCCPSPDKPAQGVCVEGLDQKKNFREMTSLNTGCTLNIVFFLKICDFSELCKFCCSAGVLPALCVYTHWQRARTEKGQSPEYLKKTQYLMNTLYVKYYFWCDKSRN